MILLQIKKKKKQKKLHSSRKWENFKRARQRCPNELVGFLLITLSTGKSRRPLKVISTGIMSCFVWSRRSKDRSTTRSTKQETSKQEILSVSKRCIWASWISARNWSSRFTSLRRKLCRRLITRNLWKWFKCSKAQTISTLSSNSARWARLSKSCWNSLVSLSMSAPTLSSSWPWRWVHFTKVDSYTEISSLITCLWRSLIPIWMARASSLLTSVF